MSLGSIHNAEQALGQAEEREGPGGDMIDRPGISILQEFLPLALWSAQNVLPRFPRPITFLCKHLRGKNTD